MSRRIVVVALVLVCGLGLSGPGWSQNSPPAAKSIAKATPLSVLLRAASRRNPEIRAEWLNWRASRQVRAQVTALPAPRVQLQSFSVGNPLPGAGLGSSNFAYLGLGASQTIPFPGTLKLRGQIAGRAARAKRAAWRRVRRRVLGQVAGAYWQLAYLRQALRVLRRQQVIFQRLSRLAAIRYGAGQGAQAAVWRAQLEQTRLLRRKTQYQNAMASLQSELRALLNWPANHPAVQVMGLHLLPPPLAQRRRLARDPVLAQSRAQIAADALGVRLAHKQRLPVFNLGYMYQHTGARFPDYYMLTLGVKLPFFWRHRQRAREAQASLRLTAARSQLTAQTRQLQYRLIQARLDAQSDRRIARLYRRGLIPQARAALQATLLEYQSGQGRLQPALDTALRLLSERLAYWRAVEQQAMAVVRIEQLTGGKY
jgi:cobalt-zinc-cadmium efflux system outer membrane protein